MSGIGSRRLSASCQGPSIHLEKTGSTVFGLPMSPPLDVQETMADDQVGFGGQVLSQIFHFGYTGIFRLRVRSLRFSASHCILKKGKSFRCISLRYPDAGGSRGCPGKTVGDHPPTALHGGAPGQKFRVPKGRQISSFDTSPWMIQMNWH